MPTRQRRRPTSGGARTHAGSGAGVGVDYLGGPVIDPTENVLALTDAESKRQDGLRDAETRRIDQLIELRDKLTQRLIDQRERYEVRISEMLRVQVENTSKLLSNQLDRLAEGITARLADLERFRYESGGKTSVTDPAMTETLREMSASIKALRDNESKKSGRDLGRGELVAWLFAAVAAAAAVVSIFIAMGKGA